MENNSLHHSICEAVANRIELTHDSNKLYAIEIILGCLRNHKLDDLRIEFYDRLDILISDFSRYIDDALCSTSKDK